MKKKRNAVILWKKRNNYGKNVMVGTSGTIGPDEWFYAVVVVLVGS